MGMYSLLKSQVYSSKGVGQTGAGFVIQSMSSRKGGKGEVTVREFYLKNGREVRGSLVFSHEEFFASDYQFVQAKVLARVPRESELGVLLASPQFKRK